MRDEKAKHFDPMIVESYERVKDEIIEVHNSIQETKQQSVEMARP